MSHAPFLSSPFLRHLAAYGASEIAAKASRLLVVVAVSRALDPAAIGVAAAALAVSDILKALTENGIVQKVIAADPDALEATCATAHRLGWAWCLGLCLVQLTVAALLWATGGSLSLAGLVAILALEYLFMPGGLVSCGLAMRAGLMRQTAVICGAQVVGANLISVALVLAWPSPAALVLPKVLTAPIWLAAMRRLRPWRRDRTQPRAPVGPFLTFGAAILGVEVLRALRMQADKLVVGAMLGAEALGLWFLAFNAGLSLATSFSVAFATVLFPHLCRAEDRRVALRQAALVGLVLVTPVVALQALLSPVYVPLLYGGAWEGIAGLVALLCLAAIPATLWSAAAQWLRAEGRAGTELALTAAFTLALVLNTVLLAPRGLVAIAIGYLIAAVALQGGAALLALAGGRRPMSPLRIRSA
ncbi:oligosaccharide flippase family protein [Roseivivax isoporae]|uniref:Polysaccharide biosynthesis protein n=1 Tax=Roseivivax isoporae LMG 25204 TaxID=1449351 RepID=X7F646_9RHOB|nr:oligosaccharide flippase family protein [Roseivivax isoporae]ETX28223.1 polysaccharide biosynthesis protein [Roseivivax isoporae LMG 25204]